MTGEVVASPTSVPAHHCVHNQGRSSMLHGHQVVAHIWTWLQQACYFMVSFSFFWNEEILQGVKAENVISLKLDQISPGWFRPTAHALCHWSPNQPAQSWHWPPDKVVWARRSCDVEMPVSSPAFIAAEHCECCHSAHFPTVLPSNL